MGVLVNNQGICRHRVRLLALGLASSALVVAGLQSPSASQPPGTSVGVAPDTEVGVSDTEAIARDLGLPLSTVEEQLGLQATMDTIDFEKLDPGFASISSELGEIFAITYATKGAPPAEVTEALERAGLLRYTTVKSVPFTAGELERAHERVHAAMQHSNVAADTYRDPALGKVFVITSEPATSAVREEVAQAANGVDVAWKSGPLSTPAASYGGYALTSCTAGFVVEHMETGNRGVATAGHCGDTQYYAHIGATLNFRNEHYYGQGDFQWHDKGGITWGARVYDGSGTRPIEGLKNKSTMNDGDPVVKYGKTTGFTTGNIVELFWCPSYVPNCSSSFVLVNRNSSGAMADQGDSGGPVMLNNVAYGFVSGVRNNDLMIFGPQQYTQGPMNVKVLTQ